MKKLALILAPILILLAAGGLFFLQGQKSAPVPVVSTPTPEATQLEDLNSKNPYGVDIKPRFDKKAVFLKIASFPAQLATIEYELTYDAKEGPRGVLGTISYKNENNIQREILLGTCSKNVCRYDEGVTKVTLTIVFKGGKTEKFQGKFDLK